MEVVVYEVEKLDRPRTVCAHRDCVEYKDEQKHYKSKQSLFSRGSKVLTRFYQAFVMIRAR